MSDFKCFLVITTPSRTFKTMVIEKGPINHALMEAIRGWGPEGEARVERVIEIKNGGNRP